MHLEGLVSATPFGSPRTTLWLYNRNSEHLWYLQHALLLFHPGNYHLLILQKYCLSRGPLVIGGPKSHGMVDSEPLCPSHHYFLRKPCLLEQWRLARSFTSRCVWHGFNSKARLRATGPLIHCWWEFKMIQSHWKTIWHFLAKLHRLSIQARNHAPEYLPSWFEKVCSHKNLHVNV